MTEPQVECVACPRVHKEPAQVGTPWPAKPSSHPRKSDPTALLPRSLWPACQDSVTALRFLQETVERLGQSPTQDTPVLGPCWDPMALGTQGHLLLDRDSKDTQTRLQPPGTPPASPQRRPRKQPNPCRGTEKLDPGFEGVTLKFQIKPDSSLQIIPTYSLPCSSRSQESPADAVVGPAAHPRGTEAHSAGSEALEPRRCASCQTQRTPLWRDAEDGTPLCNACGIRYKKYGTRCSSCWLVPRKNVQPKRLCGRCGVSLEPIQEG
ncbi:GATA-type zinc finger protein 1 [Trachypithecus francoisi]|uniref:GATA-type zinc finger protein 1 n=1 Tax=Trachypithecus francoisi TaxID=54180 RepID=UPI00141B1F5D|nr:GATA-type zinc finger protein 1 [Trachypithecus francoisi]